MGQEPDNQQTDSNSNNGMVMGAGFGIIIGALIGLALGSAIPQNGSKHSNHS